MTTNRGVVTDVDAEVAVAQVLALHVVPPEERDDDQQFCAVCRTWWPCATARACGVPDV